MYVPVPDEEADGEAQRVLQELGIEEDRIMSELKAFDVGLGQYCEDGSPCVVAFDADKNPRLLNEKVYIKSEVDKVIAELKAREDVLVTDNRNLLDKVKKLENLLRENAEHFQRNETQILENADKEIRHNKSKRCLNNAWWCRKLSNTYTLSAYTHRGWKIARYYDEKAELYRKWHKRWLSIAEKFKPNKEEK